MKLGEVLKSLLNLRFVSVFVVGSVFLLAILLYKATFVGGFSNSSADWSNFGSYIGGILGPLVSFVTLLAVLQTVYLQRELLDSQLKEFDRMNKLQASTFSSQQEQAVQAAESALILQVSAAQDSAMRAIELRIMMHERDFDRQHAMSVKLHEIYGDNATDAEFAKVKLIVAYRDRARHSVDELSKVAFDLSVSRYGDVDEVKTFLRNGIVDVYRRLDDAFPETTKQS